MESKAPNFQPRKLGHKTHNRRLECYTGRKCNHAKPCFVPKRHVPSGERLEPVPSCPAGQGQSTVPAPQSTTRKRSGEEGSRCPAAPAENPPLLPTKKRYDCFARQKGLLLLPPPLFGSPWRQAAAAALALPREESPSLSIFQSTPSDKKEALLHRWRLAGTLVARLSHTDLVGFESSRETQVSCRARGRRRCTRARGSSPASCTRASSPTSGQWRSISAAPGVPEDGQPNVCCCVFFSPTNDFPARRRCGWRWRGSSCCGIARRCRYARCAARSRSCSRPTRT